MVVSLSTFWGEPLAEQPIWVSDPVFGGPTAEHISTALTAFDLLRAASLGPHGLVA